MDLVVKNLQIVNVKYTLFSFSLWKSSGKIKDVKNFDTLLSELFLRPNFFVINVWHTELDLHYKAYIFISLASCVE